MLVLRRSSVGAAASVKPWRETLSEPQEGRDAHSTFPPPICMNICFWMLHFSEFRRRRVDVLVAFRLSQFFAKNHSWADFRGSDLGKGAVGGL
eukprot:1116169-Rhodomonas_salina.2